MQFYLPHTLRTPYSVYSVLGRLANCWVNYGNMHHIMLQLLLLETFCEMGESVRVTMPLTVLLSICLTVLGVCFGTAIARLLEFHGKKGYVFS